MLQAALARHRPPALGLRAVPPPAARGPAVRRGGRRRPGARRDRGVPVRRRGRSAGRCDGRGRRRRRCDWLADYRFTGDIWGYPEGEIYFPCSPLLVVEGSFAEAVLLETLLLSIYNHDSAIASAASRMTWRPATGRASRWGRAARTRRRRSPPRGRRTSPASPPPPTSRPVSATACRPPAPARTRFTLLHDTEERGLPRPGRRRWARARRCSSTPTTSPRRCGLGVEVAGPELGAVRIDSGDLGVLAAPRCARSSTSSAPRTPGSSSPATSTSSRSPRSRPRRSTGTASGTQLVTGSGHPTCGFVYKLVAARGRRGRDGRGGEEEQGQDLDRRPQVRAAPPRRRRASPRPR